MSLSQRSDGRFIVKYKDNGVWKQISFTDKEKAIHFDAMHNAPKEEIRLTMGELIVKYLHGNPDLFHETRERIIWLYADGGPCAFMRDKYADSLNRQTSKTSGKHTGTQSQQQHVKPLSSIYKGNIGVGSRSRSTCA